jgi:hypothetical protein
MRHNYQSLTRGAVSSFTSTRDLTSFRSGHLHPDSDCLSAVAERRRANTSDSSADRHGESGWRCERLHIRNAEAAA